MIPGGLATWTGCIPHSPGIHRISSSAEAMSSCRRERLPRGCTWRRAADRALAHRDRRRQGWPRGWTCPRGGPPGSATTPPRARDRRRHAYTATGQGTRTYVLVDEYGRVVGCFALAPHLLVRDDAPPRLARGAPQQSPVILLAKLALDSTIHGRGLGAELLVRALERSSPQRAVPADEWCSWTPSTTRRGRSTRTRHHAAPWPRSAVVMKLSTAAKALGVPSP